MSAPKWILVGTVTLFSLIGIASVVKSWSNRTRAVVSAEVPVTPVLSVPSTGRPEAPHKAAERRVKGEEMRVEPCASPPPVRPVGGAKEDFPNIDRIFQLFTTGPSKLPIVETLTYSSTVPWLKGRPAWIADYATYYNTSRHFIACSLNGRPDYFSQKVSEGSKFNVFRRDKNIRFHLLVDISRCKMGFYYVDMETNERVLLKTYRVGLGRKNASRPSGTVTPLGKYKLGPRVAIYKPGMMGYYQDQKVEMIRIFGTRWIPLEPEEGGSSVKGYGLQGVPCSVDSASGKMVENGDYIGAYESAGCILLSSRDIEELFSIVLTKPTQVEIVGDFHEAKLPGVEVATPSR